MRENRKRKTLHSAMKSNRIDADGGKKRLVLMIVGAILLAALAVAGTLGYLELKELWIRQCVITDLSRQVEIATGANIKAGLILESFGLRKDANLALIDFSARRREILERVPNIRTITVSRHLPDRVSIVVEEREPVARLAVKGNRNTGRVVDTEGGVFKRQTGTQMLPTITEKTETPAGERLSGRTLAALRLLEFSKDGDYAAFAVQDVSTVPTDYLYATLGNYQTAKIAWEDMDRPIASTRAAMVSQMEHFLQAYRVGTAGPGSVWNVTIKNRAFVDNKEPIL